MIAIFPPGIRAPIEGGRSEAKRDRNLWTKEPYGDFVLRIDWRLKKTTGLYQMPTILPDGSYKKDKRG